MYPEMVFREFGGSMILTVVATHVYQQAVSIAAWFFEMGLQRYLESGPSVRTYSVRAVL